MKDTAIWGSRIPGSFSKLGIGNFAQDPVLSAEPGSRHASELEKQIRLLSEARLEMGPDSAAQAPNRWLPFSTF